MLIETWSVVGVGCGGRAGRHGGLQVSVAKQVQRGSRADGMGKRLKASTPAGGAAIDALRRAAACEIWHS